MQHLGDLTLAGPALGDGAEDDGHSYIADTEAVLRGHSASLRRGRSLVSRASSDDGDVSLHAEDMVGGADDVPSGSPRTVAAATDAAALRQVADVAAAYTNTAFASCHDPLSGAVALPPSAYAELVATLTGAAEKRLRAAALLAEAGDAGEDVIGEDDPPATSANRSPTAPPTAGIDTVAIEQEASLRASLYGTSRGAWPVFGDLEPFGNHLSDFKPKAKAKRLYPIEDDTAPTYSYLAAPSPFPQLAPSLRMLTVFTEDMHSVRVPRDTIRMEVNKTGSNASKAGTGGSSSSTAISPIMPAHVGLTFGSERLMRALVWFAALKANGVRFVPSGADAGGKKSRKTASSGNGTVPWNIFWGGRIKDESQLKQLQPQQRINHLPGTWEMGRKDTLALHLRRAQQKHGNGLYGFAPQSYLLPQDLPLLKRDAAGGAAEGITFILKPPASACGRGIRLFRGPYIPDDLLRASNEKRAFNTNANGGPPQATGGGTVGEGSGCEEDSSDDSSSSDDDHDAEPDDGAPDVPLVQRYIHNPLLINRYKFDLRIYVLCTSFEPFSLFIYNEGLVRFAAHPYGNDDLMDVARHLTNYSINKKSKDYVRAGGGGGDAEEGDRMASKWSLHQLKRFFENQREAYLASVNEGAVWGAAPTPRTPATSSVPKQRTTVDTQVPNIPPPPPQSTATAAKPPTAYHHDLPDEDVVLGFDNVSDDFQKVVAARQTTLSGAGGGGDKGARRNSTGAKAAATTPRASAKTTTPAVKKATGAAPTTPRGAAGKNKGSVTLSKTKTEVAAPPSADKTAGAEDIDATWNFPVVWGRIKDVIIKTFLACLPSMVGTLASNVRTRYGCFELYGFDVMLTDTFEAMLIEVNAMPSLQADSALDKHIKGQLLADAVTLVGVPVPVGGISGDPSLFPSGEAPSGATANHPSVGSFTSAMAEGNNVQWRPQPKQLNPKSISFWAGGDITEECRAVLALREDQLRRRGGFDAIYPTAHTIKAYGIILGAEKPSPKAEAATTGSKGPASDMRFYDVLLSEWERRKHLIAMNGGRGQVDALRLWLLGKGPFPAMAAAATPAERKEVKALAPRVVPPKESLAAPGTPRVGSARAPSVGASKSAPVPTSKPPTPTPPQTPTPSLLRKAPLVKPVSSSSSTGRRTPSSSVTTLPAIRRTSSNGASVRGGSNASSSTAPTTTARRPRGPTAKPDPASLAVQTLTFDGGQGAKPAHTRRF